MYYMDFRWSLLGVYKESTWSTWSLHGVHGVYMESTRTCGGVSSTAMLFQILLCYGEKVRCARPKRCSQTGSKLFKNPYVLEK
jgi:hypothetical protein